MYDMLLRGTLVTGKCVPSNKTLSGPLSRPLEQLIGAANGLMPWIITALAVIIAIAAVFALRSDRVAGWLKTLAMILMVPILLWFGLMLYFVITGNLVEVGACPF